MYPPQVVLSSTYLYTYSGLTTDNWIPITSCCFSAVSCIVGVVTGLKACCCGKFM